MSYSCEKSVLQLIDQLSLRFTYQCNDSGSDELLSETVDRYKQRLKKLAFQELLRKRKKKSNSTNKLLFDCVMEVGNVSDRKLFTTMLDDYISQLITVQGEDTTTAAFEFLTFLQNTCQKSDKLTPKECMSHSVISSAAKSQLMLKRFFSGGHSVDYGQGRNDEFVKLLSATGKRSTLSRFFSSGSQIAPIGSILREPLQSRKQMPMGGTVPCQGEVDEGFVDEQLISVVERLDIAIIRDQQTLVNSHHWISSWHSVDFNEPSLRKCWDQFGSLAPASELSFSTDGDSRVNYMECVNYCRNGNASEYVTIPDDILVVHSLNVLVGVSSSTFVYHMTEIEFTVRSNIKTPTISPAALQSVLQDFALSGSCFERLSFFCKHASGLFVSCLAVQIHKLLRIVHGFVVALFDRRSDLTVFKLDHSTKRVRNLTMFLMDVVSGSLQGAQMLTYLYQKCLDSVGSQHYHLMVHLFKACCQPYMDLVQHWIYHGLPQDTSCLDEFILELDPQFLASRNRDFWTKAVTLKVNDSRSDVPLFLREHLDDVFQCGKTVMLIKACQTYHYLVSNYLQSPHLTVTFDPSEVKQVEKEADSYTLQLQAMMDAEMVARNEQENEAATKKHRIQAEIRRAATQEFEQLAKRLAEESESARVKRARELVALKEEMESSLARKKEAEADEKRRDKEMVRLGEARNQEELQRIRDIEQQARAELIAYYEELTAEAAKREQKAIWKLKRRQLHEKRQQVMSELELNPDEYFLTLSTNRDSLIEAAADSHLQNGNLGMSELQYLDGINDAEDNSQKQSSLFLSSSQFSNNSANIISENKQLTSENSKSVDGNLPDNEVKVLSEVNEDVAISEYLRSNDHSELINEMPPDVENSLDINLEFSDANDKNQDAIDLHSEAQLHASVNNPITLQAVRVGEAMTSELQQRSELTSRGREIDPRPLIRVGIQMNPDSKDILSWPEDSSPMLSAADRLKQRRTKGNEIVQMESSTLTPYVMSIPELVVLPQEYRKTYPEFGDEHPIADIVSRVVAGDMSSDTVTSEEEELTHLRDIVCVDGDVNRDVLRGSRKDDVMIPLPVLMRRVLVQPLKKQLTLVNNSVMQMYLSDYNLKTHFEALRRSLLLADPEFAHGLCAKLFPLVDSTEIQSHDLSDNVAISLTPFLRAVNFAVERCLWEKKDLLFERLTIRLRPSAEFLDLYHPDCFSVLGLSYRVDWPINVIISDSCLQKYLKIFHFLVALRRLAHVLTGLYFHMKQTQILFDVTGSVHFAKLQYARHLMQHLSNVMSDYVQDQLLNVSHAEFERSFEKAKSVDDMHRSHGEYLNAMLSRALLTPRSAKVMKLIYTMFSQVIMFQRQLSNGSWFLNSQSGSVEHSNFDQLISSFNKFSTHLKFLVKVVSSLAENGYQPHLENFLLKLNFNQFYLKLTT